MLKKRIVFLLAISLMIIGCNNKDQMYVDTQIAIKEFNYYKEFENSYNQRMNHSKYYLDSILFSLKKQELALQDYKGSDPTYEEEYFRNQNSYLKIKEEHINALDGFNETEMKKITDRLNQYFKEYGEANNFSFILGVGGQGVVLYADTALDITNEFVDYANNRYAGKK